MIFTIEVYDADRRREDPIINDGGASLLVGIACEDTLSRFQLRIYPDMGVAVDWSNGDGQKLMLNDGNQRNKVLWKTLQELARSVYGDAVRELGEAWDGTGRVRIDGISGRSRESLLARKCEGAASLEDAPLGRAVVKLEQRVTQLEQNLAELALSSSSQEGKS